MMSEVMYRVVERNGKTTVVDTEGQTIPPAVAKTLGQSLVDTAMGKSYVYVTKPREDGCYKIGRTEDLERRQKELSVEFAHIVECDLYGEYSSSAVEAFLHRFFSAWRKDGEWFELANVDIRLLKIAPSLGVDVIEYLGGINPIVDEYLEEVRRYGISKCVANFMFKYTENNCKPEEYVALEYMIEKMISSVKGDSSKDIVVGKVIGAAETLRSFIRIKEAQSGSTVA